MHMGEWVGSKAASGPPPYTTNKSWGWIVEENASLPDPIKASPSSTNSMYDSEPQTAFWDWLFEGMADVGLAVYKLDHSQQQMPHMQSLITRVGATEKWLRGMAIAAARHGISKQYGGHISSAFLHSLQLPNANQARVSDDYIPRLHRPRGACNNISGGSGLHPLGQGNVLLGLNTLYPWAVGIRPYKVYQYSLYTIPHYTLYLTILYTSLHSIPHYTLYLTILYRTPSSAASSAGT
jgi:hypothetical protein